MIYLMAVVFVLVGWFLPFFELARFARNGGLIHKTWGRKKYDKNGTYHEFGLK